MSWWDIRIPKYVQRQMCEHVELEGEEPFGGGPVEWKCVFCGKETEESE